MAFTTPKQNITQFEIGPGMTVADFGAGAGHYTLPAAERVGGAGMVYAVDIQKELISRIRGEAEKRGVDNLEVVWGDLEQKEGSRIADNIVDVVIASNILFQVKDKGAFVEEVRRVLKSGGHAVVIDWTDSFAGLGPPADAVVRKDAARELFTSRGFSIERDISAGDHHYGFIAKLS